MKPCKAGLVLKQECRHAPLIAVSDTLLPTSMSTCFKSVGFR